MYLDTYRSFLGKEGGGYHNVASWRMYLGQ